MKRLLTVLTATLAIFANFAAHAQWVVNDPLNWVQNFASATAAVKNEISSAASLIQQTNSAIHLARSTMSIQGLGQLAGLEQEVRLYNELIAVNSQLDDTIKQSQRLGLNLKAGFGASDFSWKKYKREQQRLDEQTRRTAAAQFESLTRSLEANAVRRKEIIGKLENAPGETHAIQAVGASLDVIIGQNQQMLSVLRHQYKEKEAVESSKALDEANSKMTIEEYQRKLRDAAKAF
jgi:hypothetical protein